MLHPSAFILFFMLLSTQRLKLRPVMLDDVDALHALWREPSVRRYLLDDRLINREEVQQFVNAFLQSQADRGHGLWMLEARGDTTLVGFAALKEIPKTSEVELYYGLAPQFWGQGLATEATRAVLQYGFDVLGLARLWARTDLPNAPSMSVAERLGMKPADDPGETSLVSFVIQRNDRSE
jgi:ribosomal-protein-alanine N-acetyltransferase